MKLILPRPLLWTEIKKMNEFLKGERFANLLYNNFHWIQKSHSLLVVDELVFFNELYYQLTRYYYEKPQSEDYSRYVADIKKNIGYECYVDLLMTMMYHYCRLRRDSYEQLLTDGFLLAIMNDQYKKPYWSHFQKITSSGFHWAKPVPYPQKPCPVAPNDLERRGLEWEKITNQYDLESVREVLNLWKSAEDKKAVADILRRNMRGNTTIPLPSRNDVLRYLNQVMNNVQVTSVSLEGVVVSETSSGEGGMTYRFTKPRGTDEYTEELRKKDEEILQLKKESDFYRKKFALSEKENKELKQQHEEDEARMMSGFGAVIVDEWVNDKEVEHHVIDTETHKALAESQKQNDLSQKQIKEMEQQIKVLNDKLGNTTVPLTSLSEGLKRYSKLYGLKEGKDLLKSLSYILKKEHVWIDNVENLENFFIKAEEENKTPALSVTNKSGGIIEIMETK